MGNKELALFLGMLCGDGCLGTNTKKRGGDKTYYTGFCNSKIYLIEEFSYLFYNIFKIKGNYYPEIRKGRNITYSFRSYSKEVFKKISDLGFPIGIKKFKLRIPNLIWNFSRKEKILFLKGFILTDGSIKQDGKVVFHLASEKFLKDISVLIYELFNIKKSIKTYTQKEKYISYQLILNKKEAQIVLASNINSK